MKEGDSLDYLGSALLYRLWKRRVDGNCTLATAIELHKALLKDGYSERLELRSVKRSLERLLSDNFVESERVPRGMGQPGPPSRGYKIVPDPQLITRKSTAQIILKLHHYQQRLAVEQAFISETLEMKLQRD